MDFQLSEDQRLIRDTVRDFAREVIVPGVREREENSRFPHEVVEQMGPLGLLGMMIPEEYGGGGVDAISYLLAVEEISRVCASTAVTMSVTNSACAYPIWKFGSAEQKNGVLGELARGECIGGFMLTEPHSGSDAASLKTRAEASGDGYLLNGTKAWITNGAVGRYFVTLAVTDSTKGAKGITAFIVDSRTPGFKAAAPEVKMGLHASDTRSVFLEDCRVPAAMRLGGEGEGFKIALATLDHSRLGIGAQSLGIAGAALDLAIAYTRERRQFGRPVAEFQAVQFQIAEAATQIEAARLLMYRAAFLSGRGGRFTKESSMCKVFASEAANQVVARAVQLHGGNGYSAEYEIERLYRDVRVTTIYEGTSEIQRLVIARAILE